MDGVRIVGTSTWAVFKAQKQLEIVWDESEAFTDSRSDFVVQLHAVAQAAKNKPGEDIVLNKGDVDTAFTDQKNTTLSSFYEYPYVSHLCLEPMNCTADYSGGMGE